MSALDLGNEAVCTCLSAKQVDVPFVASTKGGLRSLTFADNGTTLSRTKGLFVLDSSGGATTMNIPAGREDGEIIELHHHASGPGNAFIFVLDIHLTPTTITFDATLSGGYVKLMWYSTSWNVLARCNSVAAAGNAVASLPVIS